jgi:ABC-2 type transport system permease protein
VNELFRRGVTDHWRALAAWGVGLVAYVLLIAAIFPSIGGSKQLDELLQSYPDALKSLLGITKGTSLSSGAGFLDTELFGLMLPLVVLVFAIGSGARAFAGEEDAGRLEVVLSYPVRRRDAVRSQGLALAIEIAALCLLAAVAIEIFDPIFDLELSLGRVLAAIAGLGLLGLFFGWLALAVGAALGNRALAVGLAAGLAAGGYLVSGLHGVASWLDPFRFLSVFWWIGSSPLENGIRGWGAVVVGVAAVAILAAGALLVERRDLETP